MVEEAQAAPAAPAEAAPAAPAAPQAAPAAPQAAPVDGTPAPVAGEEGAPADAVAPAEGEAKAVDKPGAEAEPFIVAAPDGMEAFASDFESYTGEAAAWMTENPEATASDALKWAAGRQSDLIKAQMEGAEEAQNAQLKESIEGWVAEAKADPELGGADFDKNAGIARTAIDAFASDGMKEILDKTGMGSHPEFVRFALQIGRKMAEPGVLRGEGATAPRSLTNALYGT